MFVVQLLNFVERMDEKLALTHVRMRVWMDVLLDRATEKGTARRRIRPW